VPSAAVLNVLRVSFHSTLSNPGTTLATPLLLIAFIVKGTQFMKGYQSLF